jgi:gamma-glutamylputrescine oxidase
MDGAREIWEVPCRGIALIKKRIDEFGIDCDLIKQDSVFLGIGAGGRDDVRSEFDTRASLGFESVYYEANQIEQVFGGVGYTSAVRYGDTYGVNALQFVQGMKRTLMQAGVQIHESTEVHHIEGHVAFTHAGSVTADQIIVAADNVMPPICPFGPEVFHAQTFLPISEPLSDAEVLRLFPSGEHFQCWDSTLVYSYFRLTGDQRLLLGGGSVLTTFLPDYFDKATIINRVIRDFKKRFPFLSELSFIQFWPGLIDSSRDFLPIIVRDQNAPYRHYMLGCVGLLWAAFCGDFVGRAIQKTARPDDSRYYQYFTDRRPFFLPTWTERIVGKPIVFALNNSWAKYRQVDKGRLVARR